MEVVSYPIKSQVGRWEPREGKGFATGHTARHVRSRVSSPGLSVGSGSVLAGPSLSQRQMEGCLGQPQRTSQPSSSLLSSSVAVRSQGRVSEAARRARQGLPAPSALSRGRLPGRSPVRSCPPPAVSGPELSLPCPALRAAWARACVLQEGRSRG